MALEDVLKSYDRVAVISNVVKTMREDGNNPAAYDQFAGYGVKYRGISPEDAQTLADEYKKSPVLARENAESRAEEDQGDLAKKVAANYKGLISGLPADRLLQYAMNLPNKGLNYREILEGLEKGEVESARKIFAEAYKDPMWKEFIMAASKEFIATYARGYLKRKDNEFINKNFRKQIKVKENGKEVKKYVEDRPTVEAYVDKTLSKEKNKIPYYVLLAQFYAQAKEEAKSKKAKK